MQEGAVGTLRPAERITRTRHRRNRNRRQRPGLDWGDSWGGLGWLGEASGTPDPNLLLQVVCPASTPSTTCLSFWNPFLVVNFVLKRAGERASLVDGFDCLVLDLHDFLVLGFIVFYCIAKLASFCLLYIMHALVWLFFFWFFFFDPLLYLVRPAFLLAQCHTTKEDKNIQ